MKIYELMTWITQNLRTVFHICIATAGKRIYITLLGQRFTLQYGDNTGKYRRLSMEQLNERLLWLDYQLSILEDVDPEEEMPADRIAWQDAMEELEEQFDEVLTAMEQRKRQYLPLRKVPA